MQSGRKEESRQSKESEGLFAGYKGGEEMPLAGYATLVGVYNTVLAAALLAAKQSARDLPERTSLSRFVASWRCYAQAWSDHN
jgi:hypothetical protein